MADRSALRPVRDDDIDPELVALRHSRKGVGPILGLSVIALSAYLMITLREDFLYAFRGKTPVAVTSTDSMPDDAYVTLRAAPDHTLTVRVHGRQDTGYRLVAARGTGGRLWLQIEGEPGNVPPEYTSTYTGRLIPLRDLPYGDDVPAYLREKLPLQPRYVFPEALKGALPTHDVAGDPLEVHPETPVAVEERVRDVARVTVVATDTTKDVESATRLLVDNQLLPEPRKPDEEARGAWAWEVSIPGGPDAARRVTAEKGLASRTLVTPVTRRHEGTWGQLQIGADAVRVGNRTIPLSDLERIAIKSPPAIPEGAMVLVEGQEPGQYWWVPVLYGGLVLVSIFMVWAIVRGVRSERETAALRAQYNAPT